jgi:HEAT repeat protein
MLATPSARRAANKKVGDPGRLEADVAGIARNLLGRETTIGEIAQALSIGPRDRPALEALRSAYGDGFDLFSTAGRLLEGSVSNQAIASFLADLTRQDSRLFLTARLFDRLMERLLSEGMTEGSPTLPLLVQLYDALLAAEEFADLARLVDLLRRQDAPGGRADLAAIARALLPIFSAKGRVARVLVAINRSGQSNLPGGATGGPVDAPLALLAALGPSAVPVLLELLEDVDRTAHRRMICDLIAQNGLPDPQLLLQRVAAAKKWLVACDLLQLSRRLHPSSALPIALRASRHADPRVRIQALAAVQTHPPGQADSLIAQRLFDADRDVRMEAARSARARRSPPAVQALETLLAREDLGARDALELKLLFACYAEVAGSRAIQLLVGAMSSGVFKRPNIEVQVAAAEALGTIDDPRARDELTKAMRGSSRRLKEACRAALAGEFEPELKEIGEADVVGPLEPPPERPPTPVEQAEILSQILAVAARAGPPKERRPSRARSKSKPGRPK